MHLRPRSLASGLLLCAALGAAAHAQEIRTHIPGAGSGGGISGSCMYGGDGKLIFAPNGAHCPEHQQPPASPTPSSPAKRTLTSPTAPRELPASLRGEASALLAEGELLDIELARVHEAIAYEDREAAQLAVNAALARITGHLEREARLLREIAARAH